MIQESTVSNNTYGVYSPWATVQVLASNISYNTNGIIASSATISKSIISNNNGSGVSPYWYRYGNTTYYHDGTFFITYSTITGNKENGFVSKGSSTIHFSNLYNNTSYDVYNAAPFSWGYGDVNATNNWWGTTNTTEIDKHIYDYYDDYNLKKVFYKPFLNSPVTIPPIAHDVAITNVTASPIVVERWQSVYVTVNIVNEGDFDENVTVTAYYDSVQIGTWRYMYGLMPAGASATASFYWYTGVPGNYTISAEVNVVPGETDTADNVFIDGVVTVRGPPPQSPYASFTYSPYYPSVGETVYFDSTYSYDPDGYIVSYVWDFGDGTIESGSIITHVYTAAGSYAVTLTVTDNDGLTDTATATVSIAIGKLNSTISISASLTTIMIGESTTISGSITPTREGATVTIWYRLSGEAIWSILTTVTTDENSQYAYAWVPSETGTYELKAGWPGDEDTFGAESSIITVNVLPMLLVHDVAVRNVEVSPTKVMSGELASITVTVKNKGDFTETFDVTAYYDHAIIGTMTVVDLASGSSRTLNFIWDTSGVAGGEYTIKGAASTVSGEANTADNVLVDGRVTVIVDTTAPIAFFTYTPNKPNVNEVVTFDASASTDNIGISMYEWDFGDGTKATGMVVTHAFTQPGSYIVRLTVGDAAGNVDSASATVKVGRVLSIKLSGEFDYMRMENVNIRLAALVRDAQTMGPASNATVNVEIYDAAGKLWISAPMQEKISRSGIYEWTSAGTIGQLRLSKGVYLVRAGASFRGGPIAYDILLFHIDPPAEGTGEVLYYIAITVVALAGTTGLVLKRRQIIKRLRR